MKRKKEKPNIAELAEKIAEASKQHNEEEIIKLSEGLTLADLFKIDNYIIQNNLLTK